ncbi:MAG: class IV adenylate cyclase [Planctomycetes bacterium]|nr:class IV adenylate cyclase [Planctomycetota bacterium]
MESSGGKGRLNLARGDSRFNGSKTKQCHYEITSVADPELLRGVLEQALGVTQTVVKTRLLYLVGQTRVHLDTVDGLGDVLELEVVLRPGQDVAQGEAIVADLMGRLGIRDEDLCPTAYADMLSGSMADTDST